MDSSACPYCGVIFEKWEARQQAQALGRQAAKPKSRPRYLGLLVLGGLLILGVKFFYNPTQSRSYAELQRDKRLQADFREPMESAKREAAQLDQQLRTNRKQLDDVIASKKLYEEDPKEWMRQAHENSERACADGPWDACGMLASYYADRFDYAKAKDAYLKQKELLAALAKNPEKLDKAYVGNGLVPNSAIVADLIKNNAAAIADIEQKSNLSPEMIQQLKQGNSFEIDNCNNKSLWESCMQLANFHFQQEQFKDSQSYYLKAKSLLDAQYPAAEPAQKERMDSARKSADSRLGVLEKLVR